jgi:hypothetical protein
MDFILSRKFNSHCGGYLIFASKRRLVWEQFKSPTAEDGSVHLSQPPQLSRAQTLAS